MSKICVVTGKKPIIGNKISHANNKSKRIFSINLKKKKFLLQNKWIKLKVSAAGLKLIDKLGIEKALKKFK
ncbi:MAG: 50S ribosomal protein L28 [Candidatus Bostrichicola ureolyticus]|nr:MAG: 50S ribosomal protein L28 [Candidatus Bostrichicola ureolyticus]WGH27515.1 MAG: 50S ribosomal protein L28 [Candidatus Bostrichicola ureolyticus]